MNARHVFLTALIFAFCLGAGGLQNFLPVGTLNLGAANGWAASFPDTGTCTAQPTIDFPTTVTIGREYLFLTSCPIDFNAGDFVTVWIEDTGGRPIKNVSKYVDTDAGVEWVSPLSDSSGQAWERIDIDLASFDCNTTGVDYNIAVLWDTQSNSQVFSVVCPTITFNQYRESVPYWEKLRIKARVTDNRGYAMKTIPCTANVLDIGLTGDNNVITIMERHEEQFTDSGGNVKFEFSTGLLDSLLQEVEYTVKVECLGADGNFQFRVEQQSSDHLRNPLYYGFIFIADNIIPIMLGIIILAFVVGVFYMIISGGADQ